MKKLVLIMLAVVMSSCATTLTWDQKFRKLGLDPATMTNAEKIEVIRMDQQGRIEQARQRQRYIQMTGQIGASMQNQNQAQPAAVVVEQPRQKNCHSYANFDGSKRTLCY